MYKQLKLLFIKMYPLIFFDFSFAISQLLI